MNIIYLLENKNKEFGRRFYIGSKTECFIEHFEGVDRIVSAKTGRLYYGSSTCIEMKQDMKDGHVFSAKILEEVPNKKNLLEIENKWIKHYNAVESPEFYNKNYAIIGIFNVDQNAPFNEYGETILEYGKLTSSMNKKNNTAKRFGFKNLGEFCVWIYEQRMVGNSWPEIANKIGWERHQPKRYISPYNMGKCIEEYDPYNEGMRRTVRLYISKGCSINKTSELLGIEIPTTLMYIGEYDEIHRKSFLVAQRQGLTKDELEVKVTRLILDGMGFNEVSRELGINATSAKRYFFRCIRDRVKSSDIH